MDDTGQERSSWPLLAIVTVLVGIASGLVGMALGLLLRLVQHVTYGYIGGESFAQGVADASSQRRFLALCVCGAVAGIGWWLLYRFGRPLVSTRDALSAEVPRMPFLATLTHTLLQVATVALGSPLGREVAPRELGAACATWLSARADLTIADGRVMIACGAGAGLAAVYHCPLSGTLFTLEVLLGTFSFAALIPALATSAIATMVASLGLGNAPQYVLPSLAISPSLIAWSIPMGPLFGFAAYLFVRATGAARVHAPKDWRLLAGCVVVFPLIGLLAVPYPQLLGNGKGLAQAEFDSGFGIALAATLLLLRLVIILGALRAGVSGGLLTPSLSIGGLLGIILGTFWNYAWPAGPLGVFAIVGSAAFLASSMKMPITALILTLELTGIGHDFVVPLSIAVAGSVSTFRLCAGNIPQPAQDPARVGVPVQSIHALE